MIALEHVYASVAELRARLVEDDARDRDRKSGMAALRPSIQHLEDRVRPALDEARERLRAAGVLLTIETGWRDDEPKKRATLSILCAPHGQWPGRAMSARGKRVVIEADGPALTLSMRSVNEHVGGETIECEAGQEVERAIAIAVETFMERVAAPSTMQGAELRRSYQS